MSGVHQLALAVALTAVGVVCIGVALLIHIGSHR
jgi:hypothetical protein